VLNSTQTPATESLCH